MLSDVLLRTKLTPPPIRPQRVSRPRLDAKLAGATAVPVTLVSAPAGFGKTTLVAGWLQTLPAQSPLQAWLSLDKQDNDPVRFWHYFLTVVSSALAFGPSLADRLAAPQPPPIQPLLADLLNRLAETPRATLCILDDLHLIDQPEIHQGLAFLLEHAPPHFHLLLATRADPPLPLHRLRARGQLLEIRADDLRFDHEETAVLLGQAALTLPDDDIAHLNRQTEGWAAGLQLAALALQGAPAGQQDLIRRLGEDNRYILEYLAEEVLAQQPQPVQQFLLQTAILDRLCGPLCNAVTGRDDGAATLERLAQQNLFITPVGADGTAVDWFRYHPLFAALLQGHLRLQQPDLSPTLHHRAAGWFAAQGNVENALDHALTASDYDLAGDLLEAHADAVVMQGRARAVETWLRRLPAPRLEAMPRANVAFARALLLRGRYAQVEPYLRRAEASPLAAEDRAFRGELDALRATLADTQGRADEALIYARRAIAAVPEENQVVQAMAHFALAGALRETGDVAAAGAAYQQTISLCRAARLILPEMLARAHLSFLQTLRGQLRAAAATARPAVSGDARHPAAATAYATLGMIHLEWNELDEADRLLQRAWQLVGESGHNAVAMHIHLLRYRLLRAGDDLAGAQQALEEAAVAFERGAPAWLEPLLRAGQVQFWLDQDAPGTAEQVLARSDDSPAHTGDLLSLARARIRLHQRALDEAVTLLDGVLETAVSQARQGIVIEATLLRALVHDAADNRPAALADLQRALGLAEPEGYVRLFVEAGRPLAALLTAVSHPYAERLLAAFPPDVRAEAAVSPLPEPLTEREADVLQLMARGLTYQQIADELVVSVNTVRHHVKGLYSKLAVRSSARAVARARALGLLGSSADDADWRR